MLADTPAQKDRVFLILTGVWLFTALFLFGNPVILDYLHPPKLALLGEENRSDARPYLGILAVLGLACVLGFSRLAKPRFRLPAGVPKWLAWLPAAWLGWQLLSFLQTENQAMSLATVIHFASCLAPFYLGLFVLGRMRLAKLALWGAALGLMLNLADACVEKFGGLERTRISILSQLESGKLDPETISAKARETTGTIPQEIEKQIAALPPETAAKVRQLPLELVKRMYSTRLFGHMFYPNTLAGVILLLLPVSLALLLAQARWGRLRIALALGLAVVGLACLYWSGSKAGWLIAIVLLGAWFLHWPLSNKLKLGLAGAAMVLGLAGFAVKYADYFDRGATSVGARFGYWRAAAQTAMEEPLLGTGPGTFQLAYKQHRAQAYRHASANAQQADQRIELLRAELKETGLSHERRSGLQRELGQLGETLDAAKRARAAIEGAEPTRLTHNDYLQQASDSGWPGFALYAAFIGGAAWVLARRRLDDPLLIAVRLGLLAWALQGCVEFGLYIPALAWPAWLMLGWLLALPPNRFDKSAATE